MPSRSRIAALGVCWLLWIWAVALVSKDRLPWPGNPWTYDLKRRMTPLARWDSGWYVPLAERGYEKPPTFVGQQTNHAFLPLYPGLMRLLIRATGMETSVAGNLVSAASFLGLILLFAAWVAKHYGAERAGPALLAFVLFPTSFFFATVYTEALVLLLSLASVLLAEKRRSLLAAAVGFLAGLTRVSGLLLAPYLFLVSLRASKKEGPLGVREWARAALAGLGPAAGFGAFCLYFWHRFDHPFLFFTAQHNWATYKKTAWQGPFLILRDVANDILAGAVFRNPARTFEGIYLILFAYLALRLLREKRHAETVYVVSLLGVVLLSGTLESSGRYVLPAFPAFAVLGGLRRFRVAFPVWLLACAVAQAIYVFLFVNWIWAG